MKVLLAGSRSIDGPKPDNEADVTGMVELVEQALSFLTEDGKVTEMVGGGCKSGPDTMVEAVAKRLGVKYTEFPADWDKYGKAAGPIRNQQMAEYCDLAVFIWDGKSRGTKNCMDAVDEEGKGSYLVNLGPEPEPRCNRPHWDDDEDEE